jgi:hypothetical protein
MDSNDCSLPHYNDDRHTRTNKCDSACQESRRNLFGSSKLGKVNEDEELIGSKPEEAFLSERRAEKMSEALQAPIVIF